MAAEFEEGVRDGKREVEAAATATQEEEEEVAEEVGFGRSAPRSLVTPYPLRDTAPLSLKRRCTESQAQARGADPMHAAFREYDRGRKVGLGRLVALHHRSPTPYQIC